MTTSPTVPVFVIGYMRSGTSLLRNILASHPAVFASPGETKYFEYQTTIRRLYPDLNHDEGLANLITTLADIVNNGRGDKLESDPTGYRPTGYALPARDLDILLAQARPTRDYGAAFRVVMDYYTRQAGKVHWLEKTPQHTFFVDEIVRAIPDARFVEIVRDPRAVLASKKRFKDTARTTDRFNEDLRKVKMMQRVYDPFWDTLAWRLAVRAVQKAKMLYPEQIITVQYEQLIAEPENTIRPACEFLDLPFAVEMLDLEALRQEAGFRIDYGNFSTDPLERWKDKLPPAEVALCQQLVGGPMKTLGYAPVPVPLSQQAKIPLLLGRSGLEFFGRLYKRWRLGGLTFLWNTLRNYGRQVRRLVTRR
jgi:hypothetical protein